MSVAPTSSAAVGSRDVEGADSTVSLRGYRILDTPPEPAFNDIARLAAGICDAPMALISLLDGKRQWFKSHIGLDRDETEIAASFCAHAVHHWPDLFIVTDTAEDARFRANPFVVGEPRIRFYAGAVLETVAGARLGTLCVLDTQPRPGGLAQQQADALRALARQVVAQLELRRVGAERAEEARRLRLLNRVGAALAGELDLERLVQVVTDAGRELTGAAFGAFFYNRVNTAEESYTLYTLSGAPREAFAAFPMPRKTAVFGPTFAGTGVVRSDNITRDPRYGRNAPYRGMPKGHLPVHSYLAVPVVSRSGEVLGGLFFGHPEPGVFSPDHETVLLAAAAHAAVAIDNARLFEAAEREIERRREAEAALREREEDLRYTVELNPQVPWTASPGGDVLDISERWLTRTGLSREQALGGGWTDAVHPDDLPALAQAWVHSVRTGEPYDVEHRLHIADSGYRWMRSRADARRGPDGTVLRWYGTTEDVHDRKIAEAALRESEARLRATFEQAAVGMAHVGLDGRWLRVNGRLCTMLGYTEAELLERTFQEVTHPDDLRVNLDHLRRLLTGETETYTMEKLYVRKDGALVWANLAVSLVREAVSGGTPRHFISVIEDISARKAAEAALRASEARMRKLQAELLHVSRLSAAGEMASALAHELNQPLTATASAVRAAQRRLAAGPVASDPRGAIVQAGEALDLAAEQALRAGQIIRRLRDFVVRDDQTDTRLENLGKLTEDAGALALAGAREQGIDVAVHVGPELPPCLWTGSRSSRCCSTSCATQWRL